MPRARPNRTIAARASHACAGALAGLLATGCAGGSALSLTLRDARTRLPAAGLDVLVID